MELLPGTRLGHFETVSRLGAGGMGEVYEARDLRLERRVAVKVLPPAVASDPERLRRFIQEARTASSLNHPNIVTIHDVGEATVDGQTIHYIAMELIDGVTLRRWLSERPPLKQVLAVLSRAAEGLARAHSAGVVHRDLKPDNIMIPRDGGVKILDFGLARSPRVAASSDDATELRDTTREGVIMGTIGYMAPEQVEGKPADARSDVFAFGCILYEAFTGRRPFIGKSDIDVLHAVLNTEPAPITDINPSLPLELRRIVKRCLAKNPDDRFQSVKDVAAHLHDLSEEFDSLAPTSRVAPLARERAPRWMWIGAALLVIGSAAIAFFVLRGRHATHSAAAPALSVRRITTSGNVWNAALSPDGKFVVLDLLEKGRHRLVMRQLATGSEVELEPPSDDSYGVPRISRDGNYMYFTRFVRGGNITTNYIERVPLLGGKEERLVEDVATSMSLSPDETKVVFGRFDAAHGEMSMTVTDLHGGNPRVLWRGKWVAGRAPRWSPDGKWIAWPFGDEKTLTTNIMMLPATATNGRPQPLLRERFFTIHHVVWSPDSRWMWMTARKEQADPPQVWRVDAQSGDVRRVTNDTTSYQGPNGLSADGRTLLVSVLDERNRLVKLTGKSEPVPITAETDRNTPAAFALTPQNDVVFESNSGGSIDLWLLPHGKSAAQPLTSDPGAEFSPAVGPDGTIFYLAQNGGTRELDALNMAGAPWRVVLRGTDAGELAISPDGKWLLAAGDSGIVRIATTDGSAVPVQKVASGKPVYSPDGARVAAFLRIGKNPRPFQLAIFPAAGGAPQKVFELPTTSLAQAPAWTPDGRGLLYVDLVNNVPNLWVQPVDGGEPSQLTSFADGSINAYAYASDGKLLISRNLISSDVVLIDGLPTD